MRHSRGEMVSCEVESDGPSVRCPLLSIYNDGRGVGHGRIAKSHRLSASSFSPLTPSAVSSAPMNSA